MENVCTASDSYRFTVIVRIHVLVVYPLISSYHDLKNIWHSAMPDDLKRAIVMASVESILLYGSEAWTLTAVFNVTWRDMVRNEVLYGDL